MELYKGLAVKAAEKDLKMIFKQQMTHEEKELLLKDLSARLPYGVLCDIGLKYPLPLQRIFVDRLDGILLDFYEDGDNYQVYLTEVKPYLRPLSSMTNEEKEEYHKLCDSYYGIYFNTINSIDWLNSHHFDYRGLIEKGLAIKATKKVLMLWLTWPKIGFIF